MSQMLNPWMTHTTDFESNAAFPWVKITNTCEACLGGPKMCQSNSRNYIREWWWSCDSSNLRFLHEKSNFQIGAYPKRMKQLSRRFFISKASCRICNCVNLEFGRKQTKEGDEKKNAEVGTNYKTFCDANFFCSRWLRVAGAAGTIQNIQF